jgi:hypothetical protein
LFPPPRRRSPSYEPAPALHVAGLKLKTPPFQYQVGGEGGMERPESVTHR